MLSLILARLFKLAFYIMCFFASGIIISQVMQKPLSFNIGDGGLLTLGQPGILVSAERTSRLEKAAPDSTVKTKVYSKDGKYLGGGDHKLNSSLPAIPDSFYKKNRSPEDTIGMIFFKDTQTTVLLSHLSELNDNMSHTEFDSLDDGRVIVNIYKTKNGPSVRSSDTLANMRLAKIFERSQQYSNSLLIKEEYPSKQCLRIMPTDNRQIMGFVAYDVIRLCSITLLLLMISGLFKNFYWKEYFSARNVKLLKWAGWLLLIPQFLLTVFYYTFLSALHPVKVVTLETGDIDFIAQYELNSGVEISMVLLGVALLILSYVFRDGMRLKEEQALTV